jgi:Acetyltransferase (GNAT) domain
MHNTVIDANSAVAETRSASLVASATCYNLFQEPWWLDAVATGDWDEVVVKRGREVAARLPFVISQKLGRTWLLQPKLTPFLGPWLRASKAKLTNRISEQKELMEELIDALPQFDLFRQSFAPEMTYWLPFYWRGFSQTTRYTYRLSDLTDLAGLWAGVRENIRREIRKAKNVVVVRSDLDIDSFARVWALTFARQGARTPVSTNLLHRLDSACEKHNCRRMFFAEDAQGNIHAAAYLVWNAECAYYLMGGGDSSLRNSGAGSLVLWEAIAFASTISRQFDFEGSMIEPVERFFRAFGGKPVPFFTLSKLSRPMKVITGLYHAASALLGRNPVV